MKIAFVALFFLALCAAATASDDAQQMDTLIDREYTHLKALYVDFHLHPELSYHEAETSKKVAEQLRDAGYQVAEGFGRYADSSHTAHGVVGVMKNGPGPTVLVRTDMDALPVEEKTGLPYASTVKEKDDQGQDLPVMHACGHDMHMTIFIGTARLLAAMKDRWHGTLILVGQPAEEVGGGSESLLQAGLYEKYGRPDDALALHDSAELQSGKIGWVEQYTMASCDFIDVTVRGVGGHGAYPHKTKDPIVLASEMILAFQTIVSREVPPTEPAVVTVGSIHGGTKHNIIPDEVKLQLTVRAFKKEIRDSVLSAIERIAKGTALAGGAPEPVIHVRTDEYTPAVYNNPELVRRTVSALKRALGDSNVVQVQPVMAAEDFSRYSLDDFSVPAALFWVGAVDPKKMEASAKGGQPLPALHSSKFAPDVEPTMKTGIKAMVTAVLNLMESSSEKP